MKKFFKPIAVLFSAALLLTSCVDNTVSDLVNQIRTNQNALLAAKVKLAEADAKAKEISNAYQEAINAINLEQEEAELAYMVAYYANQQKVAEYQLEQAKLNLQVAIDNLAEYLDTHGLDQASEYLSNYQSTLADILAYRYDVLEVQLSIAEFNASLAEGNYDYDVMQEILARQKGEIESDLAAAEAALEILKNVAANPATAQAELAELRGNVQELENANKLLIVDIEKKTQEQSNLNAEVTAAEDLIDEFEAELDDKASYEANIEGLNESIADLNADKSAAQTALNTATTIYTNAKNGRKPFSDDVDDAEADVEAAENTLELKQAAYELAQAKNAANPTTANQAAEDAALDARDDAQADLDDANTALSDAQTALDDFDATLPASLATLESNVENAQDNLDNILADLEDAQSSLATQQENLEDSEAYITANQSAYDDAKTSLPVLEDELDAVGLELDALGAEKDANDDLLTEYGDVEDVLTTYLDEINSYIATKQAEVDDLKDDLSDKNAAIALNNYTREDVEGELAAEEEKLDNLNARIADLEALAAKWKELLDEAIGG